MGSFLVTTEAAHGQFWEPVVNRLNTGHLDGIFADTLQDKLLIFGLIAVFDSTGGGSPIGYQQVFTLDNGMWDTIDRKTTAPFTGRVQDIVWYKGKYYATGPFNGLGSSQKQLWAQYENGQWDSLPVQPDAGAASMTVIDDTMYIAGIHTYVDGIHSPGIAKFDGASFHGFNEPLDSGARAEIIVKFKDMIVVGGNLFQGTYPNYEDDLVIYIHGMKSVPEGWAIGLNSWVGDLAVYKDELYIGGSFFKANGHALGNNIVKWDGDNWYELGEGCNGQVHDLFVFQDELFVTGSFTACDGIPAQYIAKWNGKQWCSLTDDNFNNLIMDLAEYHDTLYICGAFKDLGEDSATYIAKWTGGDFTLECGPEHQYPPTGFLDQVDDPEILLYPNPSEDFITLQLSSTNVTLEILDSKGSLLKQIQTDKKKIRLDLSDLNTGMYFIRTCDDNNILTQKLMKR